MTSAPSVDDTQIDDRRFTNMSQNENRTYNFEHTEARKKQFKKYAQRR